MPQREDRWQNINRLAAERGKDNIKPDGMGWAAKSPQHRHHQALSPAGETVPS